jgi:hypothetical protein
MPDLIFDGSILGIFIVIFSCFDLTVFDIVEFFCCNHCIIFSLIFVFRIWICDIMSIIDLIYVRYFAMHNFC